jgi:hypothetical protein
MPVSHRSRAALWASLGLMAMLSGGCREEGATSSCPEIPLYDLRSDAELDPQIVEAQQAAAAAGCTTLAGDAMLPGQGTIDKAAGNQPDASAAAAQHQ